MKTLGALFFVILQAGFALQSEARAKGLERKNVHLAFFGPYESASGLEALNWKAANIALKEVNASAVKGGITFHLHPIWSENPWKDAISKLARLLYEKEIHAILSTGGSSGAHLAEQVAAKTRTLVLDCTSTDISVNHANVPWVYSVLPGDDQISEAMAQEITSFPSSKILLIKGKGHDERLLASSLKSTLKKQGFHIGQLQELGTKLLTHEVLSSWISEDTELLVLLANPGQSAEIIETLRLFNSTLPVLGGPNLWRTKFLSEAKNLHQLRAPRWKLPSLEMSFEKKFKRETGLLPDFLAWETYQATTYLLAKISKHGFDSNSFLRNFSKEEPETPYHWNRHRRAVHQPRVESLD